MSQPRVDSDGNPTHSRYQRANQTAESQERTVEAKPSISLRVESDAEFVETMRSFSLSDHGYLKIRRAALSADLHCTYTWSLGKNSGSYVYVRGEFWEMPYLLAQLWRKVAEVDMGERKATPDKYHR